MTTLAIALATLLLLLGLVLIDLGWRGRRIGDHPTCRKCGFDLSGLAVGIGPCPECGRTLDTPAPPPGARAADAPPSPLSARVSCF